LLPQWHLLLLGMFFQAGIGEETLFRGYLFGHLRNRHGFWQAAAFAAIPFVIVHLILFYSLPWSIATASILLSIAMSFPLSRLFEMNGDSVWAPAIVHFITQAGVKVVAASGEQAWIFPFFWIAVCALVPLIVYAIPPVYEVARKRLVKVVVPVALLMLVFAFQIAGQETNGSDPSEPKNDLWSREELTGDWNGQREKLREKGVDLKFRLTQFYQVSNKDDAYSGKLDTHFKIDLEKLAGWKGLSMQVKTETRFGSVPETGAAMPINSAVISPRGKGTKFSVTALNFTYLAPLNKEKRNFIAIGAGKYYSLDSSREPFTGGAGITRFSNIAANGNPAVGQTVPVVSNGATFAWIRKGIPFITFAVFDPIATPAKPGLKKLFRQGVSFVPGIWLPTKFWDKPGKHSFSATVTRRKFTPFDQLAQFIVPGSPTTPIVPRSGSWSLTYTFHQYIRANRKGVGEEKGWGVFGTFTVAHQNTNPVGKFFNIGLGGNGLFKTRQKDRFGIAYGVSGVSEKLKSALLPVLRVRDEHTFETFYNFSLTPWLWLACDFQVIRPAQRPAELSFVTGTRLVVHF
jgi:porin